MSIEHNSNSLDTHILPKSTYDWTKINSLLNFFFKKKLIFLLLLDFIKRPFLPWYEIMMVPIYIWVNQSNWLDYWWVIDLSKASVNLMFIIDFSWDNFVILWLSILCIQFYKLIRSNVFFSFFKKSHLLFFFFFSLDIITLTT